MEKLQPLAGEYSRDDEIKLSPLVREVGWAYKKSYRRCIRDSKV
jgi:transposase